MSFFERQASARRGTQRMLLLFMLAVLSIVAAVGLVIALTVALTQSEYGAETMSWGEAIRAHAGWLWIGCAATLMLIAGASWYRIRSLRQGGAAIAKQLGGRAVLADCRDANERRLRNIVEELAIAACLPVPAVFVLDDEPGINAFAAGYSPSDAAIAVTRGALERLNRDELQGVIAHEFSHVLNGDMRLNLRLMGVLFGIMVIGVVARELLSHARGGRDSRAAAPIFIAAMAIFAIGSIGLFFGRLIKASVSRSREVLADASAVQFTRQSAGLAGALKKIAGLDEGAELRTPRAEEVSHMLFGEWRSYSRWFATHPPLLDRIRVLDPSFNPGKLKELRQRWHNAPPLGLEEDRLLAEQLVPDAAIGFPLPDPGTILRPQPGTTAARVAQPIGDDTRRATTLHQVMPQRMSDAARQPASATALLLSMLIDRDRAVQARQLAEVAVEIDEDCADAVAELVPHCQNLHPALRLPLVALSFPTLRQHPEAELHALLRCADRLVHLDGRVSLFDYCLSRMLQSQVIESLQPARYRTAGRRKLSDCTQSLADLFGTLAAYGHDDPDAMRRAYVAGLVATLPQQRFDFAPPKQWIPALDRALEELDGLDATGKQLLIEGLVIAIGHDGRISVEESELIRTICACLHCPLPPVVEQRSRPRL